MSPLDTWHSDSPRQWAYGRSTAAIGRAGLPEAFRTRHSPTFRWDAIREVSRRRLTFFDALARRALSWLGPVLAPTARKGVDQVWPSHLEANEEGERRHAAAWIPSTMSTPGSAPLSVTALPADRHSPSGFLQGPFYGEGGIIRVTMESCLAVVELRFDALDIQTTGTFGVICCASRAFASAHVQSSTLHDGPAGASSTGGGLSRALLAHARSGGRRSWEAKQTGARLVETRNRIRRGKEDQSYDCAGDNIVGVGLRVACNAANRRGVEGKRLAGARAFHDFARRCNDLEFTREGLV